MNTHADKTQENTMPAGRQKSQPIANRISQKRSSRESTFQFVDNRAEALAQRKLQEMANNTPQVRQSRAFQEMANDSPQAKNAAQFRAMADNYSARQLLHVHECRHTVQQMQGQVNPMMQTKGVAINDEPALEREADLMGAKAATTKSPDAFSVRGGQALIAHEMTHVTQRHGGTVQRAWEADEKSGHYKWDAKIGGVQWFYNPDTDMMYNLQGKEKSKEYKYLDWLKAGWLGLSEKELLKEYTNKGPGRPRDETSEESYQRLLNHGKQIYQGQKAKVLSLESNVLNKKEEWENNYEKWTKVEKKVDTIDVFTGYKEEYKNLNDFGKKGRYHNRFNLKTGVFSALSNFRDGAVETLQNSDVIYFQLIAATSTTSLKAIKRTSVINAPTKKIIRILRNMDYETEDVTYRIEDDAFYVLMNSPNIKSAGFLLIDWGTQLKIGPIESIHIDGANNYTITYGK